MTQRWQRGAQLCPRGTQSQAMRRRFPDLGSTWVGGIQRENLQLEEPGGSFKLVKKLCKVSENWKRADVLVCRTARKWVMNRDEVLLVCLHQLLDLVVLEGASQGWKNKDTQDGLAVKTSAGSPTVCTSVPGPSSALSFCFLLITLLARHQVMAKILVSLLPVLETQMELPALGLDLAQP